MKLDHPLWYLLMRKPVVHLSPVKSLENRILCLLAEGEWVSLEDLCDNVIFKTPYHAAIENLYMKFVIEFENGCIKKGELYEDYIQELFDKSCLELIEQSTDKDMSESVFNTWIKSLMLPKK